MPYMKHVYVLDANFYVNWRKTDDGPEVHDEEVASLVLSAHTSPEAAAEATISFIEAYEPDDVYGPLEGVYLTRVDLDPADPTNAASQHLGLGAASDGPGREKIRADVAQWASTLSG